MRPEFMIDWRDSGYSPNELPTEHVSQCLGALWVTGYQRVDLFIWYRGMKFDLHYTAFRHEKTVNATIERMEREVERFDEEVHAYVQKAEGWSK